MARHRWLEVSFLVPLLVGLVLAFGGCKAKPGANCSPGQLACMDDKTGLFCGAGNKLATMSCSGGCSGSGTATSCDNSIAALGDGCSQVGDVACTTDKKAALECTKDNKFAVGETCKGTSGCTVKGEAITCDNDTSDIGDPCHFPGDYACTTDQGLVLRCDNRQMTPLNSCRGPKKCRVFELPQEKKVEFNCDDSIAQVGDPCDTNGEESCTIDKKALLVCQANKFASPKPCPGPAGCTYEEHGDKYTCDTGTGMAGAVATKTSAVAITPKPPKKK